MAHKSRKYGDNEIKHAARVLSRYPDARRTRILRIRLRLTVRVKKIPEDPFDLVSGIIRSARDGIRTRDPNLGKVVLHP